MLHSCRFETETEAEACKFLQRALFVEPPSRPIDLDTVPMNGTEYIHLQRLIDSTLTYAKIPNAGAEKTPSPNHKIKKFRKKEATEFKLYSSKLKMDRDALKVKFPSKVQTPGKSEKEWCLFCLGYEMCAIIFGTQDLCPDSEGHSPVLSIVVHLNQKEILLLLKYHYRWFRKVGMVDSIGEWVYALLACLEDSEDAQAIIKNFYSTCKLFCTNCDDSQKRKVNLIFGIIENCFILQE